MSEEYKKLISSWPQRWRSRKIQQHPQIIEFLNQEYPGVELTMQIQCFVENVSAYCCVCSKPVKFFGKKTCSYDCREIAARDKQESRLQKQKQTLLEKYGVDNIRNIPGSQQKRAQTMQQKYNGAVSEKTRASARSRAAQLNQRARVTFQEKYGVTNPSQLPDHYEKCVATLQKNHGVNHYSQSQEFRTRAALQRLARYNDFCPSTIEIIDLTDNPEKQKQFADPNQDVNYRCLTCDRIDRAPTETFKWRIRNTGTACVKCSGINLGSHKQRQLSDYMESLGVKVENNAKLLPEGREIDIYCPEHNLGIEFNGLFWHNDLRLDKHYHADKTQAASERGIRLIHVFEDEWEHRRDIVKSRLKALVHRTSNSIAARKCRVVEITPEQEKQFLLANHIQGYARSSVKLGLWFNDQLVSVMTFSRPSQAKGQRRGEYDWELLRFCSLTDHIVVGGAQKLFSHFISRYQPDSVLSFADSRWSQGGLYRVLGFQEQQHTALNYWYIDMPTLTRKHRYSLRKSAEDDVSLSEYQNRLNQGYLRIWDCGSSKWVWTKK